MKISVLIGSRNRINALEVCLKSIFSQDYADIEILVLDDGSTDPAGYEKLVQSFRDSRIRLLRLPVPLGVSAGRNKLMESANGEIFFIIDDDAFLDERTSLSLLVEVFKNKSDVGVVACKIINHRFTEDSYIVPFNSRTLERDPWIIEKSQYVSYFLGGAHGIRRQAIGDCGLYNPELYFGEEELDLSYRVISFGWKIYYEPRILVHHIPQPSVIDEETQISEELYHHVKNRFYLAFCYLPARYIPSYLCIWIIGKYFFDAIRAKLFHAYIAGVAAGLKSLHKIERNPLRPETIRYLQENFGRLWY
jgi:GT2 family glycosyltransferase